MTKTKSFMFLLVLLIGLLAFAGCSDDSDETPNNNGDSDQPAGDTEDEGSGEEEGSTVDPTCTDDSDCILEGQSCHDVLGVCVDQECPEGTDTECEALYPFGDADKNIASYMYSCAADSICYPLACDNDDTCATAGIICVEGTCTKAASADEIARLEINQGNGMLTQDGTLRLTATAYHQSGAILQFQAATLGSLYTWAISEGDAASVANDTDVAGAAILTGTGTGQVKVKVSAGSASAEVSYQVFGAVAAGDVRVVLYDDKTGALIGDATVYVNDTAMDGDAGNTDVYTKTVDCSAGCDFHVFHADYNYVSAFSVKSDNVLIPLTANEVIDKVEGIRGQADMSKMPPAILKNDIGVAITAFALPGNLIDLQVMSLLGEMIPTEVKLGSVLNETLPLPSGLELSLSGNWMKENFYAMQAPSDGTATAWTLGGKLPMNELIGKVAPLIGDLDNLPIGEILAIALPYLQDDMWHGLKPGLDLATVEKTYTGEGDDKTPTYLDQLESRTDVKLASPMNRVINATYSDLPNADAVITLVGAMQTGVGFVPLGLGAQMDTDKNGKIDTAEALPVKYAPQHSGLSGFPYYVISAAANVDALISGGALGLSGAVDRFASLPEDGVTMADTKFADFVTCTNFDATDGVAFTSDSSPDSTFIRASFSADYEDAGVRKYWFVYAPPGAANETVAVKVPAGIADVEYTRVDTPLISAVVLEDADGNTVSYDDLFSFNTTNIDGMNDMVTAFAFSELPKKDCDDTFQAVCDADGKVLTTCECGVKTETDCDADGMICQGGACVTP